MAAEQFCPMWEVRGYGLEHSYGKRLQPTGFTGNCPNETGVYVAERGRCPNKDACSIHDATLSRLSLNVLSGF